METVASVTVEPVTRTRAGTMVLDPLTEEELDAVTVVFHQYETGLREGTIMTRVSNIGRTASKCNKPTIELRLQKQSTIITRALL